MENSTPITTELRRTIKDALENMYMFGGMPRPDPNYDRYLNNMINMVSNAILQQKETITK
jgi:hypothetical protein